MTTDPSRAAIRRRGIGSFEVVAARGWPGCVRIAALAGSVVGIFSDSGHSVSQTGLRAYNRRVSLEVSIDPELCIGSGDCVRLVPEGFELDETRGVSVPLPGAAAAEPARIIEAARVCPTQAIRVVVEGRAAHGTTG